MTVLEDFWSDLVSCEGGHGLGFRPLGLSCGNLKQVGVIFSNLS